MTSLMSLKETTVRSITMEWAATNNQQHFVTLTEWPNKEGVDITSHNLSTVQLTNQQLMAIVNCVTKLFISQNNHN